MAKQRYAYTTRRQRDELEAMVAVMLTYLNCSYLILIKYEDPPEDPDSIASLQSYPTAEAAVLCVRRDFYSQPREERLQTVTHEMLHAANFRAHDAVLITLDELPEGPARVIAKENYTREHEMFIDNMATAIVKNSRDALLARVDLKLAEVEARRKSRQTPAAPAAGEGKV